MLHVFLVMYARRSDQGVNSAWPDYDSADQHADKLQIENLETRYWVHEVGGDEEDSQDVSPGRQADPTVFVHIDGGVVVDVGIVYDGVSKPEPVSGYVVYDHDTEDLADEDCLALLPDGGTVPWLDRPEGVEAERIRG